MAWHRWPGNSGRRFLLTWMFVLWLLWGIPSSLSLPLAVAACHDHNCGNEGIITVPVQQVTAGVTGHFHIDLQLPAGYHLTPRIPLHYSVQVIGEGLYIAPQDRERQLLAPSLPLLIPWQTASSRHDVTVDIALTFYYCRADDTGVCVIQSVRWHAFLHISPEGASTTPGLSYQAEAPEIHK